MSERYTTPIEQVAHVKNGCFEDTDGSLYVIPPNVCRDLDDDCRLDEQFTKVSRVKCASRFPQRGICPFVESRPR